MNQNIHQYLLTEQCIILLGVETTDTLSGLQQLENEPVPCGMASSLSGGQRHNANHPLIRSTPCVLFGKAGKIKGAVRADRMTSSGRSLVTGGSVFSAESRSTISQNLLESKVNQKRHKLSHILLPIKGLSGLPDELHAFSPDLFVWVRQTGNGNIFRVGLVPIVLHDLGNNLLISSTKISGQLKQLLKVPCSILAVRQTLDPKPPRQIEVQNEEQKPLKLLSGFFLPCIASQSPGRGE